MFFLRHTVLEDTLVHVYNVPYAHDRHPLLGIDRLFKPLTTSNLLAIPQSNLKVFHFGAFVMSIKYFY